MSDNTGQALVKQYKRLAEQRRPLEEYWEDAYKYTDPKRGMAFINKGYSAANAEQAVSMVRKAQAESLDSTALEAVNLHASTMYSGLTPKHSQWVNFNASTLPGEVEVPLEVREYLQQTAQIVHTEIHAHSNYDAIALDNYRDIAICGMVGIHCTHHNGNLVFENWGLDTMYIQSSMSKETIDTVYRKYCLTAKEAVGKYGLDMLPRDLRELYKEDPESTKQHDFIHVIKPRLTKSGKQQQGKRPKQMPWASVYVHMASGKVVKESGFKYFPVAVPRWTLIKDTDYAVGQIDAALPDIKMLNKQHTLHVRGLEKEIDPPLLTKNDNVVNPHTAKIGPNRIIAVAAMENLKPLHTGANFHVSTDYIQRVQDRVKRVMMADVLSPLDKANMTATEVRSRTQLMRQLTGPAYNRLTTELLQPLVQLVTNVLSDMKKLPPAPPEIAGREVKPVFQSQQARIQRMEEVEAMNEFEAVDLTNMAQADPSVLDMYDFDKAAAYKAELRGVPASVLRSADAIRKLRMQRQEEQQAMAMAEAQAAQQENAA